MENKEKIEILGKAIERLESGENDCICRAIWYQRDFNCHASEVIDKYFPEILRYKPLACYNNQYWFRPKQGYLPADIQPRIEILNKVIQELKNKNMDTELKITKEAVLAMAKKCPTAEAVLREGFPTAFEEDKRFDLSRFNNFEDNGIKIKKGVHYWEEFGLKPNQFLWLEGGDLCKWELKIIGSCNYLLIPTRK